MVRKRKNSEETAPAAPRLTRLRRNLEEETDPESTLNETSSKFSRMPKTPSTGRQSKQKKNPTAKEDLTMSTRSRRVRLLKSSSDSDIENKGEEPKEKSNRGELVDTYSTRSRAKKEGNATIQDGINSTVENDLEPKRRTRKKRVLAAADNTLTDNQSPLKTLSKSTRSQAKGINPAPDPQAPEISKPALNSPAEAKNKKSSTLRRIVETPRKVSPRRQAGALVKLPDDTVTPESSPMLVNLTPHRSSKTPKKSPMNIGSPKTHSQSPLRLSKTPRKLTVGAESPATSDKSSVSLSNQSSTQLNSLGGNRRDPFVVLTDFKKEASPRRGGPSGIESATESPPSFISVAKLQLRKSPSKLKAAVSSPKKSPKKTMGSKIRRSPVKTPASTRNAGRDSPKKTPTNAGPSNPNPESPRRPKSTQKKRSPFTSSGTPLRPIPERKEALSSRNVNSQSAVAPKKIQILMQLANSSPETTPRGRIRRSLNLTPDFIKFSSGSTSSPILTPKRTGQVASQLGIGGLEELQMAKDASLELIDISKFMNVSDDVFANSVAPADGTYELSGSKTIEEEENAENTEVKDATYELAEPKTPSLRKESRKRSLSNVEPDKCTPDAKKRCRVRFASPNKEKVLGSPINSARKSLPTANTPAKQRLSRGTLGLDNSRRRSRSLTKIDDKPAAKRTAIKRRSISASDLSNKTPKLNQSTQNSVNRLSKPRQSVSSEIKLEVKLPVPRKAPNFAQIHQKKFAEMESLVDAKKRVAKRHEELNAPPSTARAFQSTSTIVPEEQTSKKSAPSEAQNGTFNRFGFKLRKAEAIKVVTKKPAAASRSKSFQENNRTILKGVRTNRRFELQMKARNIK